MGVNVSMQQGNWNFLNFGTKFADNLERFKDRKLTADIQASKNFLRNKEVNNQIERTNLTRIRDQNTHDYQDNLVNNAQQRINLEDRKVQMDEEHHPLRMLQTQAKTGLLTGQTNLTEAQTDRLIKMTPLLMEQTEAKTGLTRTQAEDIQATRDSRIAQTESQALLNGARSEDIVATRESRIDNTIANTNLTEAKIDRMETLTPLEAKTLKESIKLSKTKRKEAGIDYKIKKKQYSWIDDEMEKKHENIDSTIEHRTDQIDVQNHQINTGYQMHDEKLQFQKEKEIQKQTAQAKAGVMALNSYEDVNGRFAEMSRDKSGKLEADYWFFDQGEFLRNNDSYLDHMKTQEFAIGELSKYDKDNPYLSNLAKDLMSIKETINDPSRVDVAPTTPHLWGKKGDQLNKINKLLTVMGYGE